MGSDRRLDSLTGSGAQTQQLVSQAQEGTRKQPRTSSSDESLPGSGREAHEPREQQKLQTGGPTGPAHVSGLCRWRSGRNRSLACPLRLSEAEKRQGISSDKHLDPTARWNWQVPEQQSEGVTTGQPLAVLAQFPRATGEAEKRTHLQLIQANKRKAP